MFPGCMMTTNSRSRARVAAGGRARDLGHLAGMKPLRDADRKSLRHRGDSPSAKLHAERPGILAWAVQGCLGWQRSGLGVPDEVRRATSDYRAEMDTLGDFLVEHCILEPRATVTSAALYGIYSEWAKKAAETPMSQKALGRHLAGRALQRGKVGGDRGWYGIRLRTPSDHDDRT